MSDLAVNGQRCVLGTVTMPFYGAWSADVTMSGDTEIASPATLVVGDMTLVGTVVRQAAFAGGRTARIVAGAAGWRKEIPAKGYSHIVGVKLSTLLTDAASACGETIVTDADKSVGTHWVRERDKAERTLHLLIGTSWWIDNAGVTQTKARDASAISNPFTVVSYSGARGSLEIATEAVSAFQPGRTFTTNTVLDLQTISSVTIESDNDGKLRIHVLSTNGATERLRTDMRALIRAEIASLSYTKTWDYTIAPNPLNPGILTTIDCTPVDDSMPALTNVPIVGIGVVSPPVTGTSCTIRFADGDPSQPECIALGGTTEHLMTTEACALLLYNLFYAFTLVVPAPAGVGVLLQPFITPAILAAMAASSIPAPPGFIAQVAAAAAQSAAMTAGTAPSNTIGPLAAGVAALATKLPDVSGLFPGIGVPNG